MSLPFGLRPAEIGLSERHVPNLTRWFSRSLTNGACDIVTAVTYTVPAGSTVTLSSYATHRRPDVWENPEAFDPDRFTDDHVEGRSRYAYFPFGGGPRHCIGHHFAMIEARLIIATLAQHFRLRPVSGRPVLPEPLVTLRPRDGLLMTVHPHTNDNR